MTDRRRCGRGDSGRKSRHEEIPMRAGSITLAQVALFDAKHSGILVRRTFMPDQSMARRSGECRARQGGQEMWRRYDYDV